MKTSTSIAVIGTGMIASALAVLTTGHGHPTAVFARSDASEERFRNTYEGHFRQFLEHGLVTEEQIGICRSYLSVARGYDEMTDAEIVFECVAEDAEVKHGVYRLIGEHCPNVRAICSVSSSIVPERLAEGAGKYADRIIVTHPFNPAHIVPYYELCRGPQTADGVLEFAKEFLESMGRKPVVLKKPTPGFIGNRLQFALWRECLALVEEGICDPRDIDTALNYSFCPRYSSIGIFEHFDNGGLALNRAGCANIFPVISDRKDVPPVIDELIAEGKTGQKAGQGFYDWRGVDMDAYTERVNAPYWKFCEWELPEEPFTASGT
ncbi:MAG: 3-hydroxyacyl-CoA dehydrogenase family protein [Lachnospiraceae bacterium]|nr:3-hydroxyacyl-CoA dehydrogenase family protein [Lachnospiraceae bacterium]